MPGLWHGGPPASACREDKGERCAGSAGPGSGRAGGGRSRLPRSSRHRPGTAARPPAPDVRRPHRSWTAGAVSVGGVARQGSAEGGLLGPHACPEVRSGPGPRAWIPWPHSLPPGSDCVWGSRGQGGPGLWKRGRKADGEGEPSAAYRGGADRRALVPKTGRGGGSFGDPEAAAEQAPAQPSPSPGCLPAGALTEPGLRAAGRWAGGRWGAQDTPEPQTQLPQEREAPPAPWGIICRCPSSPTPCAS